MKRTPIFYFIFSLVILISGRIDGQEQRQSASYWFQQGRSASTPASKISAFSRAIAADSAHVEALLELGIVYRQLDNFELAEKFLRRAYDASSTANRQDLRSRIIFELALARGTSTGAAEQATQPQGAPAGSEPQPQSLDLSPPDRPSLQQRRRYSRQETPRLFEQPESGRNTTETDTAREAVVADDLRARSRNRLPAQPQPTAPQTIAGDPAATTSTNEAASAPASRERLVATPPPPRPTVAPATLAVELDVPAREPILAMDSPAPDTDTSFTETSAEPAESLLASAQPPAPQPPAPSPYSGKNWLAIPMMALGFLAGIGSIGLVIFLVSNPVRRAHLLYLTGFHGSVIQICEKLLEKEPDDRRPIFLLAQSYAALGRHDAHAVRLYEKALLTPDKLAEPEKIGRLIARHYLDSDRVDERALYVLEQVLQWERKKLPSGEPRESA